MELDIDNEKVKLEKNGVIYDCDILFTFDSEDTKKSYVGYTDHTTDSDGKMNIYVSSYSPLKNKNFLDEITDSRELEMVQEVIEDIKNGKY